MTGGKVVVLGGGMQGRAVIEDLEKRSEVEAIVAADLDTYSLESWLERIGARKTSLARLDARNAAGLRSLISAPADIVIDMLPVTFTRAVAEGAVAAGTHLVNTNYGHALRSLDAQARRHGIAIMPEAGFDPGIDLVVTARAAELFDEIHLLNSYAGGIPAAECRDDNPLSYKISWNFAGVLGTYVRDGLLVLDGKEVPVPSPDIFRPPWARELEFADTGTLEAFVNGDAAAFVKLMGLTASVKAAGRYALRWPGHCEFWSRIVDLGLLSGEPDEKTGEAPREFLRRLLEPRLLYAEDERDMVVLRVDAAGKLNGRARAMRWEMVDYRDLKTGLMAMNRTVGYPASIIAQMILSGAIKARGVASPATDVPPGPFLEALAERGIRVKEEELDPAALS